VTKPKTRVKLDVFTAEIVLAALRDYHRKMPQNAVYTEKLRARLNAWVDEQVIGPKASQRRVVIKANPP